MDRRTTIKWMLAAASLPMHAAWATENGSRPAPGRLLADASSGPLADASSRRRPGPTEGYGTDPDVIKLYRSGDLWPLTFTDAQRITAAALCGVIIPADAQSPSAAQLRVHLFIDEWISAPYPRHAKDRTLIVDGIAWLDQEAARRFKKPFASLLGAQQRAICDDICWEAKAKPEHKEAARFFARFRDLTADGFYTTPEGMKDIGYVGNKPSVTFDGPPPSALKKAGLA